MKTIKQFCKKNNWESLLAIIMDWCMIIFAISLAVKVNNPILSFICIWFIGIKQYALGEVFVHEASHNNLFKTIEYNTKLQFIFAYPFLTSVQSYRREHIPHHNSLGNTKIDPLCLIYKKHGLDKVIPNMFWIWFVRPLFGIYSVQFYKDKITNTKWVDYKYILLAYLVIIWLAYSQGFLLELTLYWLLPYVWCMPAFYCWQEIEDHYNTRDIARTNVGFIRNLLAHNTGYHYAHHMCPGIPWYNLSQAHYTHFSSARDVSKGFLDTFIQLRKSIPAQELNKICINK